MATIEEYFGANSTLDWRPNDVDSLVFSIDTMVTTEAGLVDDPNSGSAEKGLIAMLNVLFEYTKDQTENPNFKIVGTSSFVGKRTVGLNADAQIFDTYDLTFQVRLPSSSGSMPDPDNL